MKADLPEKKKKREIIMAKTFAQEREDKRKKEREVRGCLPQVFLTFTMNFGKAWATSNTTISSLELSSTEVEG